MRETSVGSLPGDNSAFKRKHNNRHTIKSLYFTWHVKMIKQPTYSETKYCNRNKEFERFNVSIDPINHRGGCLPHNDTNYGSSNIQKAIPEHGGVPSFQFINKIHI